MADVEGITLYATPGDDCYLIVSVQGASRYALYERGDNRYLGVFRIGASADRSAGAVSGADGTDVISALLGSNYPQGLFVTEDDENANPQRRGAELAMIIAIESPARAP